MGGADPAPGPRGPQLVSKASTSVIIPSHLDKEPRRQRDMGRQNQSKGGRAEFTGVPPRCVQGQCCMCLCKSDKGSSPQQLGLKLMTKKRII